MNKPTQIFFTPARSDKLCAGGVLYYGQKLRERKCNMQPKTELTSRERAKFLCDTAGSILSIRVRGEIDHHTASDIRRGIDGILFEKQPKRLILDLSAVSFMDSSGLGLIMGRYSVMKELGGEMIVWNPSPETRSILTLAGMERMVRIEYPEGCVPAIVPPNASGQAVAQTRRRTNAGGGSGRSATPRRKAKQVRKEEKI